MRAALVAVAVSATILVPVAVWYRPASAPAVPAAEVERPDRVLAAVFADQLPFGMPDGRMCDCNRRLAALLVQDDVIWLGDLVAPASPARIPRDGTEWAVLEPAFHSLARQGIGELQVAVHDDARYEDLLTAMLLARSSGLRLRVIQPALPTYPNHGRQGGMGL